MNNKNIKKMAENYLELELEEKIEFLSILLEEMEIEYILEDLNKALKLIGNNWFQFNVLDFRK